jgi:hypothetical protein
VTRTVVLLYRALIRAQPVQFRRRFGEAMEQSFREGYAGALRKGDAAVVRFVIAATTDALVNAVVLRGAALRDRFFWPDPIRSHQQKGKSDMWWQILANDARYAFRMFRRSPVFAVLAVAALGLGIGANTAIFTLVDGVLLRPLPYASPDRLVMIWSSNQREHREHDSVSPLDFMDFKRASAFSSVEAVYSFVIGGTWSTNTGAEPITFTAVTPGLFDTLGRAPALGRTFTSTDLQSGIIISYDFWQRRLGGDPEVLGRVLNILYQPRTVVGVMPKDFVFPYRAMLGPSGFSTSLAVDIWFPLSFVDDRSFTRATATAPLSRQIRMLSVIARLRDGVTPQQARAETQGIARQLAESQPNTNAGIGAAILPVHEQAVGSARPALLLLLGGVGLVLLMACVNLANMLLARSTSRHRELAVRAALGAGRRRLIAQTLVESVLLSSMGGLVALALLTLSLKGILALAPPELPRVGEIHAHLTVFLFAAALSIATGIVIGLVPAFASSRADVNSGLKQSERDVRTRATASPRRSRRARSGAGRSAHDRRGSPRAQLRLAVVDESGLSGRTPADAAAHDPAEVQRDGAAARHVCGSRVAPEGNPRRQPRRRHDTAAAGQHEREHEDRHRGTQRSAVTVARSRVPPFRVRLLFDDGHSVAARPCVHRAGWTRRAAGLRNQPDDGAADVPGRGSGRQAHQVWHD